MALNLLDMLGLAFLLGGNNSESGIGTKVKVSLFILRPHLILGGEVAGRGGAGAGGGVLASVSMVGIVMMSSGTMATFRNYK